MTSTTGARYWNAVVEDWPDRRECVWRAHADAVNAAWCGRWLPAGVDRLLKTDAFDEAVGPGLWPVVVRTARRVEVIDHAWSVVHGARTRHEGLSATGADVRRLPFADRSFDVVLSNSTLDHFVDPEDIGRSLGELHRVLRSGGRLLLTLDNAAHPLVRLRNALPGRWLRRVGLVPYFVGETLGPADAAELVRRYGFRVRDVTAILHGPRVLAVPLASLADRLGPNGRFARGVRRGLAACERAERWSTRFRTGHYVALVADKA